MSHLATIIARVQGRISVNSENLKTDQIFLQAVCNLKEYKNSWSDYTEPESELADILFENYKYMLIGTTYEDVLT